MTDVSVTGTLQPAYQCLDPQVSIQKSLTQSKHFSEFTSGETLQAKVPLNTTRNLRKSRYLYTTSPPYQGTQRSTSSITKESVYSRNAPPKQHSTNTTGSLTTHCTSTDTQKMASLKLSALRIAHETPSHRTQNGYISKSRSSRTDWTAKSQEPSKDKTCQYTLLTNPTI